jgi:hypothetical protein
MATSSPSVLSFSRRSTLWGLLVAGAILFLLAVGGSSLLLGSDCGPAGPSPAASHGRA